jgi:hypothetical protein
MNKYLLVISLMLTGCVSSAPITQRVDVPVAVACVKRDQIPERPQYEPYDSSAADGDVLLAVSRNWFKSRPYEAKLEAIANGCAHE